MALKIPAGHYEIRVGKKGNTRRWEEGKVLIFDDSFEHEVEARPDACGKQGCDERIVLIVDLFQPSLTAADRDTILRTWQGEAGADAKAALFPATPRLLG